MPQYQAKAFRVVRCPLRISPPRSWLRGRARQHPQTTLKIFLMALQHIYTGKSKFTDEEIDEIDLEAPDLIPNRVATILQQSRPDLAGVIPANQSSRPHKVTPRPRRSPVHVARAGSANYVAAAIEEDQRPRASAQGGEPTFAAVVKAPLPPRRSGHPGENRRRGPFDQHHGRRADVRCSGKGTEVQGRKRSVAKIAGHWINEVIPCLAVSSRWRIFA